MVQGDERVSDGVSGIQGQAGSKHTLHPNFIPSIELASCEHGDRSNMTGLENSSSCEQVNMCPLSLISAIEAAFISSPSSTTQVIFARSPRFRDN